MGDEILVVFALLTQAAVRRRDHVFRWGGAIFLIWAPETDPDAALRLANQLRMTVDHHEFPGVGKASISCGLATHRPGESFSDWLARVDFSLNRAQSDGQNSCFSWEAFWRGDSPNFRILWQPAWESGQEQIDREHQGLIAVPIVEPPYLYQYDPAMVALDLPQFVTMIRDHFAHEEEILAAMHYPELDDHRQIHQQLLAADEQYARQYENGEVTLMQAMEHLIGDTIVYHMLNDDRRFFHWIRTSGPL
jgi:hemerythrin-like metal-binding protein